MRIHLDVLSRLNVVNVVAISESLPRENIVQVLLKGHRSLPILNDEGGLGVTYLGTLNLNGNTQNMKKYNHIGL